MFFFKKMKSRSLSFDTILGFDYEKIDFSTAFPAESYASTSLAVCLPSGKDSKLIMLDSSAGNDDPVFKTLLEFKKADLQRKLQEQHGSLRLDSAWGKLAVSRMGDAFIHPALQTSMADILDLVFQCQVKQQRPVLVNFEQNVSLNSKPARLNALVKRGVSFQVGLGSLLGFNGQRAKRTAYHLLLTKRVASLGVQMAEFELISKEKELSLPEAVLSLLDQQEPGSTDLMQSNKVHDTA